MAQQVLERRLRPGADVEDLVGAGPGEVAPGDVADGVATGLPRREADGTELSHHCDHVIQLDEVELDVLPGGDVAPPSRVRLGDVGEHLELIGRERSVGGLDADHLVRRPWRCP